MIEAIVCTDFTPFGDTSRLKERYSFQSWQVFNIFRTLLFQVLTSSAGQCFMQDYVTTKSCGVEASEIRSRRPGMLRYVNEPTKMKNAWCS